MEYNKFNLNLKKALEERFGSGHNITISSVLKNNNIELDTILIQKKGTNISPTLYLEQYYEQYCEGASIEEIIEDVVITYENTMKYQPKTVEETTNFSECMSKVYCRLVNYEKNKTFLESVPHIKYLDLAITFYYLVEENKSGIQSFVINNSLFETWMVTIEELYEIAKINTQRMFPARLSKLADVIMKCMRSYEVEEWEVTLQEITANVNKDKDFMIYVLTNKTGINGAAVILYTDVLKKIAKSFQNDLYLLPSSIHEFLILPKKDYRKEELEAMVQEVNQTQVLDEEILAQHIYEYVLEEDKILL